MAECSSSFVPILGTICSSILKEPLYCAKKGGKMCLKHVFILWLLTHVESFALISANVLLFLLFVFFVLCMFIAFVCTAIYCSYCCFKELYK